MLKITAHPDKRGFQLLEARCEIPRPINEVFAFFSDASQLEQITPPELNFHVITPGEIEIKAGTLIDYRLRMHGIPMRWRSEITLWEPTKRFVDVQVKGPYRSWHHEHNFESDGDHTVVHDRVEYAVPGGWLINKWFVQKNIEQIFQYRIRKLQKLFSHE